MNINNVADEIIQKFSNKKGGINTQKIKMECNSFYLKELISMTSFLPEDTHLRYRFNYIKYGFVNKPKKCKTCKIAILVDVKNNYCSLKCSNNNELVINKMKNSWNKKTYEDIENIQNKRKSTNLKKYGVDIASKLPEVIEKNKQTQIKNWGDYAMRNISVLQKRNTTYIERYGGLGMSSSLILEKIKKTNFDKYGVEYYSKTKEWYNKCTQSAIEKYGKEWVSKVDFINCKQQSGGYSYYDFEFPSGKIVRVQGYEPIVLTQLLILYNEDDIVTGVQNIIDSIGYFYYEYENKSHRYYPDIYIKSKNLVIEVKSNYTFNKEKEKNLLKRQAVLNKNIDFKFIIL